VDTDFCRFLPYFKKSIRAYGTQKTENRKQYTELLRAGTAKTVVVVLVVGIVPVAMGSTQAGQSLQN